MWKSEACSSCHTISWQVSPCLAAAYRILSLSHSAAKSHELLELLVAFVSSGVLAHVTASWYIGAGCDAADRKHAVRSWQCIAFDPWAFWESGSPPSVDSWQCWVCDHNRFTRSNDDWVCDACGSAEYYHSSAALRGETDDGVWTYMPRHGSNASGVGAHSDRSHHGLVLFADNSRHSRSVQSQPFVRHGPPNPDHEWSSDERAESEVPTIGLVEPDVHASRRRRNRRSRRARQAQHDHVDQQD